MDAMMADDMSVKSTPSWPAFDLMMPGGNTLSPNPNSFSFPLSQGCTCNGMTGPCAPHLEEMRFKIFNPNPTAPPNIGSPYAWSRAGSQCEGGLGPSAVAVEGGSSGDADILQQPQGALHHRPSHRSLSTSTSAFTSNPQDNGNSLPRQPHRYRSSSSGASRPSAPSPLGSTSGTPNTPPTSEASAASSTAVSSSSDAEVAHNMITSNSNHNDAVANDTSRFKTILEAVKAVGFADFDCMAAAYYTATFERSSVPAMAQRASRARRLAKMLKDVHESSKQWPRWEARGFRESAIESAKTICVDEIEKVAHHIDCTCPSGEGESRSVPDGLCISNATTSANAMSMDTDINQEGRLLSQLSTLPEDVEATLQDEAPYLWSLFTELVGPQGLYCDRVSQAVLALLIEGRRSQQ